MIKRDDIMKSAKLFLTVVLVLIACMANSAYAADPHTVYGECMDADDGTPANGAEVTVYIESRPNNTLNDIVGPSGNSGTNNTWMLDLGNMGPWSIGEILIIEADNGAGYFDRTAVILTGGLDKAPDMKLRNVSDAGYLAIVMGTVYDIDTGLPVPGAGIHVECLNNSEDATALSGPGGYYMTALPCPMNGTVRVTAVKASIGQGENTGVVEYIGSVGTEVDVGITIVDVTIPEFPITALPAVLSMLSFGLVRKRLF